MRFSNSILIIIIISLSYFTSKTEPNKNPNIFNEKNLKIKSSLLKSQPKGLIMIEEPSNEDLSKDIKNFEINIKKEGGNPLDQLTSESVASSETSESITPASQTSKDDNLMKNTDSSKYNTETKVLGGEEEKKTASETENEKESQNESQNGTGETVTGDTITTKEKTTGGTTGGARSTSTSNGGEYEEKTKVFHLNPESIEPSQEQNTPDISAFYSILFIGVLCTLALLIIALRNFFQKYFELYILNTLKYILMDIIILISVITIIELLYYHGVFDSFIESIDIYGICLAFSMFAIIWLLISALYTIIFQFYINKWNEYELLFNQQDNLLKEFKEKVNRKNDAIRNKEFIPISLRNEIAEKSKQIEYILMRQSFIAPSFLPSVSEAFLRDDFNFSEYLGRVLSKIFTKAFVFSISSFIFILGFIYIWTLFSIIPSKAVQLTFVISIPFVTFGFLLVIQWRVSLIHKILISKVNDNVDVFFANFTQKRDPFLDFIQPIPLYLEKINELQEKKIQESLLGGIKIPNKHENLFPLNSPLFTLKIVNFCLLTLIIWLIIAFSQHIRILGSSDICLLFFVFANLVILISFVYLIPNILKNLAIVSNIGMLKDQKIIQEVVISQRNLVTPRFAKLYRLFKSIRKQLLNQEDNPSLERGFKAALDNQMKVIKDQIEEYFNVLSPNKNNGNLDLANLIKLTHLCGHDLTIDELVFLAREASSNEQDTNCESFLKAVYLMAEDVKLDPYKTSKEILMKLKLEEIENDESDLMSINDFKNILQEHKTLLKDDVDIILNEIYYISDDGKYFSLDKLACLIRDSIEGLAR